MGCMMNFENIFTDSQRLLIGIINIIPINSFMNRPEIQAQTRAKSPYATRGERNRTKSPSEEAAFSHRAEAEEGE